MNQITNKPRGYTSTVHPSRSIAAIEDMLSQAGALHIAKSYRDGEVVGFLFQLVVTGGRPVTFKMPCSWEPIEVMLTPRHLPVNERLRKARKGKIRDQAKRTAWRLMHDWIDVQLTMIALQQVEAMQVFLPYAYNQDTDKTLFETMQCEGFKQLQAPEPDPYEDLSNAALEVGRRG